MQVADGRKPLRARRPDATPLLVHTGAPRQSRSSNPARTCSRSVALSAHTSDCMLKQPVKGTPNSSNSRCKRQMSEK